MHEVVAERAAEHPDKVAINSWDGDLTYAQIDRYSSFLAASLREAGVKLHDFLPVCFEKSRWTTVAVLAVMKSGATLVLMDPTLPLARLQNMASQVGAKAMLSSHTQHSFAKDILPTGNITVVGEDTFANVPETRVAPILPNVPASALMYIIFTSGSTGSPKGVKISHSAYTSSAIPRAKAVGYVESNRTLDFASYAFDVSIDSMLCTLANGGCLCIPSDEDRLNDINGVIRSMKINYAGITPSVARILDLDVISAMTNGLGLGGEAISARDASVWGKYARIVIGYGPCECTIGCTINSSAATGRDYISIGPGNGAVIWIVNPDDHESLVPVGAVGELLVEGPIVGQGYLNDPEKTAAAFIHDPTWLVAGHGKSPGRRGRLYKTGDLGRYDPDGSGGIVFVGRKDTQVKLRGQRVELGEIESQLKARLPTDANVIVEVVTPKGSAQPALLAFVAPQTKGQQDREMESRPLPDHIREALSQAEQEISAVLPRYMVPNAYIPVNYIPALISGKTDRKRLRQFGAAIDLRQLEQETPRTASSRPLTDMEERLRQAWGLVLKLDPEKVRPHENFFALGGDSLAAMRLVPVCREQGLDLSVSNTFNHPTLSSMAAVVRVLSESSQETHRQPFSMLSQPLEIARLEAAHTCGVSPEVIEDIYPCTPTQESLFTFSLKSTTAYIAQRVAEIPSNISLEAWRSAWEAVVAANPILRTRIVQFHSDTSLQQVVLASNVQWHHASDLPSYLAADRADKIALGHPLARYALVVAGPDKHYMVWTVHHALYDGWSEPLLLAQVLSHLQNKTPNPARTHMADFVHFLRSQSESEAQSFWRRELAGATGPQFPVVPSRDFLPKPTGLLERRIALSLPANFPFTRATLLRAAWAVVAARRTGSDDMVLGETLTGRDVPLPGIEGVVGPVIATVPVRVRMPRESTVEAFLDTVQRAAMERAAFQHVGVQNIRKISRDAQIACEMPMGMVVQPSPGSVAQNLGFEVGDVVKEAINFNPYSLMLACGMGEGEARVCASFDPRVVGVGEMERVLAQFDVVVQEILDGLDRKVSEIGGLGNEELEQIWKWNEAPPLALDAAKLRADEAIAQGTPYPRVAVPWVCDPRCPSLLTPIGCTGELWLEGNFFSGAPSSPRWLEAGSPSCPGRTGKAQPTGDIVKLCEDGSLVFVGRKETIVPAQGHSVNVADLESHFERHLPSFCAAAVVRPAQGRSAQKLLVVLENPAGRDTVDILPAKHNIKWRDSESGMIYEATVCAGVSADLATALKKFDKFAQNSLSSHLAPSSYIVLDEVPTTSGRVDRTFLSHVASAIPLHVLDQLSLGFSQAWDKLSHANVTVEEGILRSAWAKILGRGQEQIDIEDNFFRLGGDSVLAMKLVSYLRSQGHGLTVADIFQHMRLGDAAKKLKVNQASGLAKIQPYKAFSLLGAVDPGQFVSNIIRPKLGKPEWSIRDVYPVTDSQVLDIKATVQAPRTSMQYNMLHFDHGVDSERLLRACHQLVQAHDILRTVFVQYLSTFYQVVLADFDAPVTTHLADRDLELFVADLCNKHIEAEFPLGSPFLHIFLVEGLDGQACLVIALSHALYDGIALPRLLRDLETLYSDSKLGDFEPFSTYISQVNAAKTQNQAIDYWRALLRGSTLALLPRSSISASHKSVFTSTETSITRAPLEITTASLLSSAWALLLARRLGVADVTFGGITSGRGLDLPMADAENIIGPCYQFTPIRVSFQQGWTALDLLRFVQVQAAESSAQDFLGFDGIATACTRWSDDGSTFFDSVVHHQDWEDFDDMPWAGGRCRVAIANPHGDAAWPMKAVSFLKEGRIHVGVVGGEDDKEFLEGVLGDLKAVVEELAGNEGGGLLGF